jgi:PD-(D/E)XK nuclease superfamily
MAIDWRSLPPVPEAERPVVELNWRPSQSFLKLHDRCDRAAFLYLHFGGGAPTLEMNRGKVVHDVIERCTNLALDQPEPEGRMDVPEIAKDVLLEYLAENPQIQLSAVERDACRAMVYNWALGDYWDPEAVIAIETPLTMEVAGFEVVGHVDRAEAAGNTVDVIDFKTEYPPSNETWKRQAFDADGNPRFAGNFQTVLYAALIAFGTFPDGSPLGEGFERFRLRLLFPRILSGGVLAEREAVITRPQLLDFKLDLEAQLERLRDVNLSKGLWQPTPGTVCRECPAENACPLPRILRPESQHATLDSIEDLERAAAASWFMAERAKTLKTRVKKAAERLAETDPNALVIDDGVEGVRIGGDLAFLFVPNVRESVRDKSKLYEAIEAANKGGEPVDFAEHFTISEGIGFEKRKVSRRKK